MSFARLFLIQIVVLATITACDDEVSQVGNALVTDTSEIVIDESSFTVDGISIPNNDIQSRTITQLLGQFSAKEFGEFSSEFVTQFMPALKLDTTNVVELDKMRMRMLMFVKTGDFTGDSLVPMGLKIYPLTKKLPSPIYSDFDPTEYYDESDCWTPSSHIYTANGIYNDSVNNLSYRTVNVELPNEFALKFYEQYKKSPQTFASPQAFEEFFHGIYVKNSFGAGRVINVSETRINLDYYRKGVKSLPDGSTKDTLYKATGVYMAVSPEVISNNIIKLSISDQLKERVTQGENILVGPTGYDVKMTFPAQNIIDKYRTEAGELSVVNSLSLTVPVEKIENNYNINPPEHVLLVLATDKAKFFNDNMVSDNKTSFLGTYNSSTKNYVFSGMRNYIIDLLDQYNSVPEDKYTFIITPVDVVTETSTDYYGNQQTIITGINPYLGKPAMCKLDFKNAKIKFTYSKQSINNY